MGVLNFNCNCENLPQLKRFLTSFANNVNQECNETLTTIFLQTYLLQECISSTKKCSPSKNVSANFQESSIENYKWGLSTRFRKYCNKTVFLYKDFQPVVIVVKFLSDEDLFNGDLTKCAFYQQNNLHQKKLIKKISISDTDSNNVISMRGLVNSWKKVVSDPSQTLIISKAFDTPYQFQTNGWWYLSNDPGNSNTSEFVFYEKIKVAEHVDAKEDPKNFEWLFRVKIFNRNSTGILFTGQMNPKILTRDFCRVMTLHSQPTKILLNTVLGTEYKTKCGSNWQVIFRMHDLGINPSTTLPKLVNTNLIVLLSVSLNFVSFTQTVKNRQKVSQLGVRYGYAIHTDVCKQYTRLNSDLKPYLNDILGDEKSVLYIFLFQETEHTIRVGATRNFRRKTVLFKECRKMVFQNRNSIHTTEIGFALTRYYKTKEFYKSPWAMQNFVKYIDLLSTWAEKESGTVAFVGTDLDTTRYEKKKYFQSPGWYSHEQNYSRLKTKWEEALELSLNHYTRHLSTTSAPGLSIQNVVLVACVSLLIVVSLFVTAFYFVQSYYKTMTVTRDEIDKFVHGNKQNENAEDDEIYNAPYDKTRYEIAEGDYMINHNDALGSGEFGKVYSGIVDTVDGEIEVAVKTTNPLKFHKTTIQGLLSEIKVLAYLGKHKNIIELLGANIGKLKFGRVLIFLELCELGSLEKHLRNLSEKVITYDIFTKTTLSITFYEDMYRWSSEICNGMSYLAEKHVVHADLATRNVLLNQHKEVKLCDFGLSRRMLNYSNYVKTGQEPLPWKWMAPESLTSNQFSEKSDVWSFGVTLWEIYSLGDVPYPGLSWEQDFPLRLQRGFRLPQPKYNEKDM